MSRDNYNNILLITDMDGTLLNSSSKVSKENLSAIQAFVDRGGNFTVATGRMHTSVRPYISNLPLNTPAILYNGAMIYDFNSNKVLWQQCLKEDAKPVLKWIFQNYPDVGIQIYSNDTIFVCRSNIETEKHLSREKLKPIVCDIDDVPFPWIKTMLIADNKLLKNVKESLKDKEISFRTVFSEPQFLEMLHTNTSKGTALNELIKILGFSRNNVVSLGDNLNDIELIDTAGIGIAVDNAHLELKQIADYCCCNHNDHAIAEIIKWIDEEKLKL